MQWLGMKVGAGGGALGGGMSCVTSGRRGERCRTGGGGREVVLLVARGGGRECVLKV
jgi:hypothetical protein